MSKDGYIPPKKFLIDELKDTEAKFLSSDRSLGLRVMKFGTLLEARHRGISEAPSQLLPEEGMDYWVDEFASRCLERNADVCLCIDGSAGRGKSTLALIIGSKVDPTFLPNLATRLVYSPLGLIEALETIEKGQAICFDESALGLASADSPQGKETSLLLKALTMSRFKGCILILIVLSIHNLQKQIRTVRLTHWMAVSSTTMGQAIVHEKFSGIRYRNDASLVGFSVSPVAPYVEWHKIEETSRLWQSYEENKEANFQRFIREAREALSKKGEGRPSKKVPALVARRIAALHKGGMPLRDIAKKVHLHHRKVRTILDESGVAEER
jgi:hypothetical protein